MKANKTDANDAEGEAASVLLTRVRKESALRCWTSRCGSGLASSVPLPR